MKILILEPYCTGSHKDWAEGYSRHSDHDVEILGLPGNFWKWRMHGGAVTLSKMFLDGGFAPDVILATDMLDLSTFLALTKEKSAGPPTALYFHENQLTYPWSPKDRDRLNKRDQHYGFINYVSALAADRVFFNSQYHLDVFIAGLHKFLRHFPDYRNLDSIAVIQQKSSVLPLGLDLARFDQAEVQRRISKQRKSKLILWNHRWEFDKNPKEFFDALFKLAGRNLDFEIAILGECFSQQPEIFLKARAVLGDRVVQFGYAENFSEYAGWLKRAEVLPVTSNQDFFGASIAEAIYCGCFPLLPKRLAYPELIPAELHEQHFYENFDDLLLRLERLLKNETPVVSEELRSCISQFSWENMAVQYDKQLSKLIDCG